MPVLNFKKGKDMERDLLARVESIRDSHKKRMDGGAGSGNWGHVGRPGERGGSESGGGNAFRLVSTSKGAKETFKSQAKLRDAAKKAHREAKASGNKRAIARIEKRMSRINMTQKTADKSKAGRAGYSVVKTINKNASRDILADKKGRGATARESTVTKVKGTKEAVRFAFPKRTTRGGTRTRGGKTSAKHSKV